ncbi:hypothetical protein KM92DES2_20016 [uncultured Desulfovibrio sp.]|uniref:Uncharacterized protein n=1 Tax=uncultured Desulfovibrio sp. TaxID=167968 RepID=A0A212KHT4_9BACT|nr:hypothetical protein KM92DES2_20016 [uncultured Desulfovibrio sp.]
MMSRYDSIDTLKSKKQSTVYNENAEIFCYIKML